MKIINEVRAEIDSKMYKNCIYQYILGDFFYTILYIQSL